MEEYKFWIALAVLLFVQWFRSEVRRDLRKRRHFERDWRQFLSDRSQPDDDPRLRRRAFRIWEEQYRSD